MSVGTALEKIVVASAKGVADLQIGVNKILWGSGNTQPVASAKYDAVSGSLQTTLQRPQGTQPQSNAPNQSRLSSTIQVQPGLYGILDAMAEADLCNIISYLTEIHEQLIEYELDYSKINLTDFKDCIDKIKGLLTKLTTLYKKNRYEIIIYMSLFDAIELIFISLEISDWRDFQ